MFEISNLKFKNILNINYLKMDQSITCLVGTSGSGKTTLLKHLNKLYTPDSGSILYNGENLLKIPAIVLRRQIVMLSQIPIIYSGNLEENLQIGRIFSQKPPVSKEQLEEAIDWVKLNKPLDDACINLSGGEKQRVCLARVILMDADTYLFDEPSAALDKDTERFIIQNLASFVLKTRKEMVMVTHSQEISNLYPESIVCINKGEIGDCHHE